LLFLAFFFVVPAVTLFAYSFLTQSPQGIVGLPLTLAHYQHFFGTPLYAHVLWTTLKISLWTTAAAALLAYPVALLMVRSSALAARVITMIVVAPLIVSVVVRTYGWQIILGNGPTGVLNWLLLASIHKQETDFSTAPTTYHGLNFAHCCGGPMQFNVTNGPVTTWQLVSNSYIYGKRPASYDHMTATHPSIYDDFDSIMAAAHLLSADGAEFALDGAAWDAAYDYYGHDATGVTYADQVLARAIGWSQHGFCINCGVEPALVEAVQAAYGAPVLAVLEAETKPKAVTATRSAQRGRHG